MWAKLDDKFPRHPKVRQCNLEARWLFIIGVCHAAEYLTDGFLRRTDVAGLTSELRRPKEAIQQLVTAGLWERVRGGYAIHDFLQYNPSRKQVETERAATRDRVHAWRGRNAVTNGVRNASPVPSSSRPVQRDKGKERTPGGESRPGRQPMPQPKPTTDELVPMPDDIREKVRHMFEIRPKDPKSAA